MTLGKIIRTKFAAILLASFTVASLGMLQLMQFA